MTADPSAGTPNRLAQEKSPYLQQHAHNPVDWYPWGEEAAAKARRENKPIFLSIGYSTCHWCHVMERESFENPEIAQLLNQSFVSIKVDREEHPDVDQVYMTAVTAMTGQGGWPLTAFLTPELKPFFGGTYFPPERRWQMAGMKELLPAIAEAWATKRGELTASAERMTEALQAHLSQTPPPAALEPPALDAAFQQAAQSFDPDHGGFGGAPKFPRPHELMFLLRYWARAGAKEALGMAAVTLERMAQGGLHDHLGGGFHRYSTDERWLVPHFEKMLYDQALLAKAYLEAFRAAQQPAFAEAARGALEYVLRDLTDPGGAFYSAEDADSEGVEGKFYVWTPSEMLEALGPEAGALAIEYFGVTPEGHMPGETPGTSILHVALPLEEFAARKGMEPEDARRRISEARAKLLAARSRRVRPHRDDKILTSWNGLMIGAFAYGAATLEEPRYAAAAERAAAFILSRVSEQGRLLRRFRDGQAKYAGTLEDYAFLIDGLIELYQAAFDPSWLAEARRLAQAMVERFWDGEAGGFFLRGRDEDPLIVRSKEVYDGATPSGNSVAASALLRLGRLLGDQELEATGRRTLDVFAQRLLAAPFASPHMFMALDFALGPAQEIVIAGAPDHPQARAMVREVHGRFLPRTVLLRHDGGPRGTALESLAPFVAAQRPAGGAPAAYVCRDRVCRLPATDAASLREQLDKSAHAVSDTRTG
jgi:uncharacterized protein YyaL (SSP411 family)